MAYMTARKRAVGLGSARTGTEHHWQMTISSYALLILTPLFLIAWGPMLGQSHEAVLTHFARPFPAIVTGLMLVVGLQHFRQGVQTAIEDYTDGVTRHLMIVAAACVSYGAMATGLFALVRLAL
ncbi:succinate dehydrogenase, hydrophobic membrane anchor protein [Rhodovulum sp. 12E13]|uniref:succinate dehydrogenase, hydrophobic membrane anchor protein n=1 Tax=Rhodovulum sp. 12E13 TaxID=2203891 RepID=UPI000E19437C|nr:succinate dehydrogenase, hydrophobic membrane anchor protein [Rhodovulum sp. 12E13]RDC72259.1 succinate dehydrogenase, hydrophobic membrane anchor protein [Rhodovulum sp. 12E13]